MLLYIIRHGEPIYGPDTLTELGKKQAEAVGKRLSVNGFDRIYTSPNGRARETAQPTCDALGITPEILPWTSEDPLWDALCDPNVGWAFNGDVRQIKTPQFTKADSKWYESPAFAETHDALGAYEHIGKCSDEFLASLGYVREGLIYKIEKPSEERVAVFCHQGFGVTWLSHILGIPPCLFWTSFDMSHTGVTVVYFENNEYGYTSARCLALSDTAHIYESGLPYRYAGHNKEEILL